MTRYLVNVHTPEQCAGEFCCIHNPSNHHMVTWPQHWRGDRGIMERACPHGIGHPDPDDLAIVTRRDIGVHGCDGCCVPPTPNTRDDRWGGDRIWADAVKEAHHGEDPWCETYGFRHPYVRNSTGTEMRGNHE